MTKLPDGPKTPRLLQLIQWIADSYSYLEKTAKRYGDPFTANFRNWEPFVFFSHPQANQEIFQGRYDQFESGSSNGILRPLLGDNSLLLIEGDRAPNDRVN
jgi:cytochrome P450 family 110